LRLWALPCVVGVTLGSAIATFAPAALFKIVFATVSAAIGVSLLVGQQVTRVAGDLPGPLPMRIIGIVIGVLSALMFGRSIHQAVATSAGLGIFISVAGTIGYALAGWPHMRELPPFSIGDVSVPGATLLTAISLWIAPLGARLAHAIPRRRLELAFATYLLTMSARFVVALMW
jgi:uncharacterized membrane protein YfcA